MQVTVRPPNRDLWPHLLRAVRWPPVIATAAAASLIGRWAHIEDPGVRQALTLAILAGGSAFVFDDPAANTLASSPAPLWRRRTLRLWLALPLLLLGAVPVVLALASRSDAGLTGNAALELAVWVWVVLAAGAAWGGAAAAPFQLLFAYAAFAAPSRFALYPVETHHLRWLVVGGVAFIALRALSRDPER